MLFVGRESEIARIEKALHGGRNIVLCGKYGIGRTALIREIARRNRGWRFIYANFGDAGTTIATEILSQLTGRSAHALRNGCTARRLVRSVTTFAPPADVHRVVIVFDNIAKVTRPKLALIRSLRDPTRFAFAAIVEHFVRDEDLMRIRVALDPAIVVALGALNEETSTRFFANAAAEFDLPWSDSDVAGLARTMHGYPLEMVRTVRAAQRRTREVRARNRR
ncbi:MAG TPA: ATP-binding protein [Thermoanaerobaculia bacterium]|nr:ATP-binding protein [Thermoanaerobaculia bacterium]